MVQIRAQLRGGRAGWLVLLLIGLSMAAHAAAAGQFVPGGEADGPSSDASVSADGRFVVFASAAANLVPDDDNEQQDIFLRDRQTGETRLVSRGAGGAAADGLSEMPVISADGRVIAFNSLATNLVPADYNMDSDVFVYDRETEELALVSQTSDGVAAAGGSYQPALSADGRYVAFLSAAVNLDPLDDSPSLDVFIHDLEEGTTTLVSKNRTGTAGAGGAERPSISADGRLVVFTSYADDLVAGDNNEVADVYVRDRQAGTTTRITRTPEGDEVYGDSYEPVISADGQIVVFYSDAFELTDDEVGWGWNVYAYDRQAGETTLISRAADGGAADSPSSRPKVSGDGRYVVFESEATNLLDAADENGAADVFLHDRQTGETTLASVGAAGPGDGDSTQAAIAADGGYVVFQSLAGNLTADDSNLIGDIFLRDLAEETTERVSLASAAVGPVSYEMYLSVVIR